ncbi:MAG: N-acetyl-alpha-D-glucosaminyl L-malate synthase [Anaerolineales bacterium]|nr:N-acetyl-alpha-D-glucosaminyl L-malate synthase [Anaerolineales bacterium]
MKAPAHRPKIWMLIPTYHPVVGGAQTQVRRLSSLLKGRGWDVEILTRRHWMNHLPNVAAHEIVDGAAVTRLSSRGGVTSGSILYVLGGLWYLARFGQKGIYHAHDIGAAGWLAVMAARLFGGHSLLKFRTGRSSYEKRLDSLLGRRQLMALLHKTDRAIVVNEAVYSLLIALGAPAERVAFIPNAVDVDYFQPALPEEKRKARARLGLPAEQPVILYVGRLSHIKGVDILLQAWALLSDATRGGINLTLVGDGEERAGLEKLMVRLGIADRVRLAGMQENVRDYYWAADILVLPSRQEGMSNVMMEAMGCGLPVLASATGGALDVIVDGKNGWLFETENPSRLCDALLRCLQERPRWYGMGREARLKVCEAADIEVIVEKLETIYRRLACAPGGGQSEAS